MRPLTGICSLCLPLEVACAFFWCFSLGAFEFYISRCFADVLQTPLQHNCAAWWLLAFRLAWH
jgi:hypothetical protein